MNKLNDLNRIAVALEKLVLLESLKIADSDQILGIRSILKKTIFEHNKMVRQVNLDE